MSVAKSRITPPAVKQTTINAIPGTVGQNDIVTWLQTLQVSEQATCCKIHSPRCFSRERWLRAELQLSTVSLQCCRLSTTGCQPLTQGQ